MAFNTRMLVPSFFLICFYLFLFNYNFFKNVLIFKMFFLALYHPDVIEKCYTNKIVFTLFQNDSFHLNLSYMFHRGVTDLLH